MSVAEEHDQNKLPEASLRLFCIPQAGMGCWVYQKLAQQLGPSIQVVPVEVPGHGARMKEPRCTNMAALVQQLQAELLPDIRRGPYALFGHSLGAWVAYEMAHSLQKAGAAPPLHLFASGNRAPCLSGKQHDVDPVVMHRLSCPDLYRAMERRYGPNPALAHPKVQELMYPMLRDDFEVVETYQEPPGRGVLTVPITVFAGQQDPRYNATQVAEWSQHTSASYREVWLPDVGHNYIEQPPALLAQVIQQQLASATAGARTPTVL